jgi:hypothetical protein
MVGIVSPASFLPSARVVDIFLGYGNFIDRATRTTCAPRLPLLERSGCSASICVLRAPSARVAFRAVKEQRRLYEQEETNTIAP